MTSIPHLVGMIHLAALPGSPGFAGSMDAVLGSALDDAALLKEAGFPALMIENFGDAPFYTDNVPPETVAGMTRAVDAVILSTGLPVGVNVLRNDALAAIAIAAATGAAMIRVNVLAGTMYTDQGPIIGRAADVLRKRSTLSCSAEIWADVLVKHATPPPGSEVRQVARDMVERSGADAVIVSGAGTGSAPDYERLKAVREAVGEETRIIIGSGATADALADLAAIGNSVIVGSAIKRDGLASNPVDLDRARDFVSAAANAGLVQPPMGL